MASKKWSDKSFGEAVRKERDDKGWTQPQMAEQLGMHPTTLAKIEKGDRSVRIVEAVAIADLFGVSLDRLLGRRAGIANEVADIVGNLQHAAGRAVADVAGIHSDVQGWFNELGEVEFDGSRRLQKAGGRALKALTEAQAALYDITTVPPPQRVVMSRIEELIERKAEEKANETLHAKLMKLVGEDK